MMNRYEIARDAIRARNYNNLGRLLRAGLNPNVPAADGRYLVHDAVLFDAGGMALRLLAKHGADLNARWANHLKWTPAHLARFKDRVDVIKELRALGADVSLPDDRGWVPGKTPPCPITLIEAQRKFSPMATLVHHCSRVPQFA